MLLICYCNVRNSFWISNWKRRKKYKDNNQRIKFSAFSVMIIMHFTFTDLLKIVVRHGKISFWSFLQKIIVTVWETVGPKNFILSVCPAFTTCIWIAKDCILMKLGGNVGSSVWLIVLKFHRNQFSDDVFWFVGIQRLVQKVLDSADIWGWFGSLEDPSICFGARSKSINCLNGL